MKILEFAPTESQIERAKEFAKNFKLNSKSFLKGERNVYAFLGEIVVGDFLSKKGWVLHPEGRSPYDFDLVDPEGKLWEIKTKMTTVFPKGKFNCSTYTYRDQKCDGYIFTRCMKDLSKVWMLGWISKRDLFKYGTAFKAGDVDDNLVIQRDMIGIEIRKLNPFLV